MQRHIYIRANIYVPIYTRQYIRANKYAPIYTRQSDAAVFRMAGLHTHTHTTTWQGLAWFQPLEKALGREGGDGVDAGGRERGAEGVRVEERAVGQGTQKYSLFFKQKVFSVECVL
jgi:hypothetical protein